jgi:CheY-like chemotaxis protein/uncharacterized protein YbaR (Trm112 family)
MICVCQQCGTRTTLDLEQIESREGVLACPNCGEAIRIRHGNAPKMQSGSFRLSELMAKASRNRRRLLIVDGNRFFREALEEKLAERGDLDVLHAADGATALATAKRELPLLDFVLLELELPDMSGLAVLEALRQGKLGQDLPVAVVSEASLQPGDIVKMRELGALGFVNKNLPFEEIQARLEKFLAALPVPSTKDAS